MAEAPTLGNASLALPFSEPNTWVEVKAKSDEFLAAIRKCQSTFYESYKLQNEDTRRVLRL